MRPPRRPATPVLLVLPLLVATACYPSTRRLAVEEDTTPRRSFGNVLTAEEIEELNTVTSVADLLRVMPGIIVRDGAPGNSTVRIQGQGDPLYVVDGVPQMDASAALSINPRDIARIEILKEGGAVAQYGFRGSSGVIVIRTK